MISQRGKNRDVYRGRETPQRHKERGRNTHNVKEACAAAICFLYMSPACCLGAVRGVNVQ